MYVYVNNKNQQPLSSIFITSTTGKGLIFDKGIIKKKDCRTRNAC